MHAWKAAVSGESVKIRLKSMKAGFGIECIIELIGLYPFSF